MLPMLSGHPSTRYSTMLSEYSHAQSRTVPIAPVPNWDPGARPGRDEPAPAGPADDPADVVVSHDVHASLAWQLRNVQAALATVAQAHRGHELTLCQLIATVAAIVDIRDNAVAGHSQRVARYATELGQSFNLTDPELELLHTAGLLHDLGKVAIPDAILHKPGRLTPAEWAVMQRHAAIGEQLLATVPALSAVARLVGEHHERYDGTGYPAGKRGEAISLGGRILAVADALDAMLSHRPYARACRLPWVLAELDHCAGAQFDPAVVVAVHRLVERRGPQFFQRPQSTAATSSAAAWPDVELAPLADAM